MSKHESDKKIATNTKLELVRAIRMQNQHDRQLLKYREGIIYPEQGKRRNGEIYSLEETTFAPGLERTFHKKDNLYSDLENNNSYGKKVESNEQTTDGIFKGLRLRFVIAMVLFLGFVYCDVQEISVGKYTSEAIMEILQEEQLIELKTISKLGTIISE